MKLVYSKRFLKNIKKFPVKVQGKARARTNLLIEDPYAPVLRRHKLKGKYEGYESIDVTGDVRIIIHAPTQTIIDVKDIGTHSYLYQ